MPGPAGNVPPVGVAALPAPVPAVPDATFASEGARDDTSFRAPATPPQVLDLPRASGPTPFAPWHDGSPPVVGAGPSWRGWVTFPAAIGTVALASSTPIFIGLLLAFVVLPAFATIGDLVVHQHRQLTGATRRGWHRARPSTIAPALFLRNLGTAAVRAVPAIAIGAIAVVADHAVADTASGEVWRNLAVRLSGVAIALVLLVPARHGGRTFRSDLGITEVASWVMEGKTRPGTRVAALWVVSAAAFAFGAWLHPELWPLR